MRSTAMKAYVAIMIALSFIGFSASASLHKADKNEVQLMVSLMNGTYKDLNVRVTALDASDDEVLEELHILDGLLTGKVVGDGRLITIACSRPACSGE